MKRIFLLQMSFLASIILFACSSKDVNSKPLSPEIQSQSQSIMKETWESEWDQVLSNAKKEGKLVIYTGIDPHTRNDLGQAFKGKFGTDIEWLAARGGEIGPKIAKERGSGIYYGDLYIGGGTTALTVLKPIGALSPLEPLIIFPEVKEEKNWWENRLPFIDRDKTILSFLIYPGTQLAVNTNLVNQGEITAYKDLLSSKWKGKILMEDPTISGSINRWARVTGDFMSNLGWEYQRLLAKQEPFFLRDERMMAEWLSHGKYPVLIGPDTQIREMIKIGAPVAFINPAEGAYIATGYGNVAYFDKSPHPWSSRVFVNWLLSKEGQSLVSVSQGKQSARIDISTNHLDPTFTGGTREDLLKKVGTLINPDAEYYEEIRYKAIEKIMEIWGPLRK